MTTHPAPAPSEPAVEGPPAASAPALTMEVSATVSVEETVDLVALFASMGERERTRYHSLDPHEFSIAVEWERPLAYLWPDASDVVPMTMVPGTVSHPRGDIHDSDVRVISRNGDRPVGADSRWTEADYTLLASQVPWLAEHAKVPHQPRESTDNLLKVEVTATVGVDETMDPLALFASMGEREQKRYFGLDLSEVGFDAEWERPLAYLWPDDDLVPYTMVPGCVSHPHGMVDDAEVRVTKRFDTYCVGAARHWTEADYLRLVENVAWLGAHERRRQMSAEDRARLPGPGDVPLFG